MRLAVWQETVGIWSHRALETWASVMQRYFVSAFKNGCQRVVLIGSDIPNLPATYIQTALQRLEHEQVVLGPSEDGGYYLSRRARLGLPDVFSNISWSTGEVFAQTVERPNTDW